MPPAPSDPATISAQARLRPALAAVGGVMLALIAAEAAGLGVLASLLLALVLAGGAAYAFGSPRPVPVAAPPMRAAALTPAPALPSAPEFRSPVPTSAPALPSVVTTASTLAAAALTAPASRQSAAAEITAVPVRALAVKPVPAAASSPVAAALPATMLSPSPSPSSAPVAAPDPRPVPRDVPRATPEPPAAPKNVEEEAAWRALRHDLRGILSPALLMADRLLMVTEDPLAKRTADAMIDAVERAEKRMARDEKLRGSAPTT